MGDAAYIIAGNINSAFNPPLPYPVAPYPVTVVLASTSVTIATLGLAEFTLGAPVLLPTLDIENASLTVSGAIVDHFNKTLPTPIGTQSFTRGGTILLGHAASLRVGGTVDAGINVSFADTTSSRLLLDGVGVLHSGAFAGTIQNYAKGNLIDLSGVAFAGASEVFSAGQLTISLLGVVAAALKFAGSYVTANFRLVDNGSGSVEIVTCFARGTRIQTPNGEVAVEDMRPGDSVITLRDGEPIAAPVIWIGRRRLHLRRDPENTAPIRISRDAFSNNVPARDLLVSPDHCLHIDGVLIPARLLINAASIVQETRLASIEYFHVELATHAVLLAEGLEAESYLDTGNRAFFANAGTVIALHPAPGANTGNKTWQADACAPLAVDAARVEPIWRRLAARAGELVFQLPGNAAAQQEVGLHLLAGGRKIRPSMTHGNRYGFVLPRNTMSVRLVSGVEAPATSRPWLDDRRRLGVCVGRITVQTEDGLRDIPVDHPALSQGWWRTEGDAGRILRWTNGNAAIVLPAGARMVEFWINATGCLPSQVLSAA